MIRDWALFAGILNAYGLMNLLVAVLCSAAFLHVCIRSRFLFLRPSLLLAGMMNILFQWPLAAFSGYYLNWLPHPLHLSLVVHAPVLAALSFAALGPTASLHAAWARLPGAMFSSLSVRSSMSILGALGAIGLAMTAIYLAHIPYECTGLYALTQDLANIATFREISLKGLSDTLSRYSVSLLASAVVPLFCMMCAINARGALRRRAWGLVAFSVALFVVALPFALLTGAKGSLVNLTLQVALLFIWQAQLPFSLRALVSATLLPLIPALTLMMAIGAAEPRPAAESQAQLQHCRADIVTVKGFDPVLSVASRDMPGLPPSGTPDLPVSNIFASNARAMAARVLEAPLMAGGWYVHHEQTQGPVGIAGVQRLARLTGIEPTNISASVARIYSPVYFGHEILPSATVNVGFTFNYYAYFGLLGVLVCIGFMLLLDASILLYRYFSDFLLAPYLATVTLALLRLLQADFTVVVISHGLGLSVLLLLAAQWCLDRFAPKSSSQS